MSLTPAELKCYLVVLRAIQRDRNGGKISARQVSARSGVALRHAHEAMSKLVQSGRLRCEVKGGSTAVYSLPIAWQTGNCIPTGEQLGRPAEANCIPVGKRLKVAPEMNRIPTGAQNCFPVGKQHLEYSEKHTPSEDSRLLIEYPAAGDANGRARSKSHDPRSGEASAARSWPMGGWKDPEGFEVWWRDLVRQHPNKNRNAMARLKVLELIMSGQLERAQFEAGYAALRAANRERWAEQNGRFTPNLWQILDDLAWKFAPERAPAASEYQDADAYLRRVENE
jgi:hypothetical protein